MGNSLTDPAQQPDGTVFHARSETKILIRHRDGQMEHHLEHEGASATYPIAYGIGAGQVGYSYIVRIGRFLFQSPASYYMQKRMWDVTPGYEDEKVLDFTHPILSGCLFCHTGSVNLITGTNNQYADPALTAISCERCHGNTAAHFRNPVPGSIINPAKLPTRARDSVCEQCHLEGDERVLNPGRDWWDFKAGNDLESTFAIYLNGQRRTTRAVSQVEHLAQSQCARMSGGKLWCGTCHDPHGEPAFQAVRIRQACLSCHQSLFEAGKHAPAEECTSCHMPRVRPNNIAHAEITDHRIVRRPGERSGGAGGEGSEMIAWHEPAPELRARDLGVADFNEGLKYRDTGLLRDSYEILSALPAMRRDPDVLADLASVLLRAGHPDLAVNLFREACAKAPNNSRFAYTLGAALQDTGEFADAIIALRRSIALDPSLPDAYIRLAQIYRAENKPTLERQTMKEYLSFMPQNVRLHTLR
jgi:predicted CXXCH cytochrome family protein